MVLWTLRSMLNTGKDNFIANNSEFCLFLTPGKFEPIVLTSNFTSQMTQIM